MSPNQAIDKEDRQEYFTHLKLSEGKSLKVVNGIPDFRQKDEYWCNVSRDKMRDLIDRSKSSGDWLSTANRLIPRYVPHFQPFYRADAQFLWPTSKDSRILDAGSMWGGVTIPAAQYHKEVYAVDKTMETLEFLKVRANQMGLNNVYPVASGVDSMPFEDNFFDLVILNGVLEWVAYDQEIILENQWSGLGRGLKQKSQKEYKEDPRDVQLRVLKEARRILNPDGALYLAIENSVGYIYLMGYPDNHMNLPFLSFLPRKVSDFLSRVFLKTDYRTYVYNMEGYKKLLKEAGFDDQEFYGSYTHYINAKEIVPVSLARSLKKVIVRSKGRINQMLLKLVPAGLLGNLAPSFSIIASNQISAPRILSLLNQIAVIDDVNKYKAVKWDGRLNNDTPVNYVVYEESKPKYFCKICRNAQETEKLTTEAGNLNALYEKDSGQEFSKYLPVMKYFGTVDGVTFMVTDFIEGDVLNTRPRIIKGRILINEIDRKIYLALDALIAFQQSTAGENLTKEELFGLLPENISKELENVNNFLVKKCGVHNDFNFCNLLFNADGVKMIDFENFKKRGLPFIDLANIIFNTILMCWGDKNVSNNLSTIIKTYGLEETVTNWLRYYAKKSGVSFEILRFLGPLSVLTQEESEFPEERNPIYKKHIKEDLSNLYLKGCK